MFRIFSIEDYFETVDVWNIFDFVKGIYFYRATLCVSAVFAVARCSSARPSVCLSDALVYSIQPVEDIVRLFVSSGNIILVFGFQRRTQFQGEPLSAGVQNTRGVVKICDFRRKSPFISVTVHFSTLNISETTRDRAIVTIERQ